MENINLYEMLSGILKWFLLPGTGLGIAVKLIKSYPEKILENIHIKILRKIIWEIYIFIILTCLLIIYPIFINNYYNISYKLYNLSIVCSVSLGILYLISADTEQKETAKERRKFAKKYMALIGKITTIVKEKNTLFTIASVFSIISLYFFTESFILSYFNETFLLNCKSGLDLLTANNSTFNAIITKYPEDLLLRDINKIKMTYIFILVIVIIFNRLIVAMFEVALKKRNKKQFVTIITVDGISIDNCEYINTNSESYIIKDFKSKSYQFISKSIIGKVVLQEKINE